MLFIHLEDIVCLFFWMIAVINKICIRRSVWVKFSRIHEAKFFFKKLKCDFSQTTIFLIKYKLYLNNSSINICNWTRRNSCMKSTHFTFRLLLHTVKINIPPHLTKIWFLISNITSRITNGEKKPEFNHWNKTRFLRWNFKNSRKI